MTEMRSTEMHHKIWQAAVVGLRDWNGSVRLAVDPHKCISVDPYIICFSMHKACFCVCLFGDDAETITTCSWYSYVIGQHGCVFILQRVACLQRAIFISSAAFHSITHF